MGAIQVKTRDLLLLIFDFDDVKQNILEKQFFLFQSSDALLHLPLIRHTNKSMM